MKIYSKIFSRLNQTGLLPILGFILLFFDLTGQVEAKTIYVDTAGDDSVSYSQNDSAHPWQTLGRAAWGSVDRSAPNTGEAAQAGDMVIVRAGTYTTTGTGVRYIPAYNPANSGTAGNPITFQAEGTVNLVYSSGNGPVIGAYNKNYITWKGFTIDEATAPAHVDTGPVVLWVTTGSVIENCDIDGNGVAPVWGAGELHNGVRIGGGGGNIVRNNYIHDVRQTNTNDANASAILVDQSAGGLIENNEIAYSNGGFDIKRNYLAPGNWVVRYNYIHDSTTGVRADQLVLSVRDGYTTNFYQNILRNTSNAFVTNHYENREAYDMKFVNNTVISCGLSATFAASLTPGAGHKFYNNIITDCPATPGSWRYPFMMWDYAADLLTTTFDSQHNIYHSVQNDFAIVGYEHYPETKLTFAGWQALGQDVGSQIVADPGFVDEIGGNYKLSAGSPANNFGVDLLDLDNDGSTTDTIPAGAYITGNEVIGLTTGSTPPSPPTIPQNPADTTNPTISITSPTAGSTVSGSSLSISATASDNVGVIGVQFKQNGVNLGTEYTSAPYSTIWDTTSVSNGNYTITATARDSAGNTTTSNPISVTVSNSVVTPSTPAPTTSSGSGGGGGGGSPFITYTSTSSATTTTSGSATSTDERIKQLQTLLASLLKQVADLQTQLSAKQAGVSGQYKFTRNLSLGMSGNDVKQLQIFLNVNGYTIATKGIGMPGNEGTYFGIQTKQALSKYQAANNVSPASGFFGPKTREKIQK